MQNEHSIFNSQIFLEKMLPIYEANLFYFPNSFTSFTKFGYIPLWKIVNYPFAS